MTQVLKDKYSGWKAEDSFHIGDRDGKKLVLDITTTKYQGKLKTIAMVSHVSNGIKSTTLFQDFYTTVQEYDISRVTERAVTNSHSTVDTDHVIRIAKTFYGV